jgi:hypothetical protein
VPIIVVSARDREADKIRALDAGADDYLTKPFGAGGAAGPRLRVALRHAASAAGDPPPLRWCSIGLVDLDLARREVSRVGGEPGHLTPIEYKLLVLFVQHAGKVLTHRHLLAEGGVGAGLCVSPGRPLRAGAHGGAAQEDRGRPPGTLAPAEPGCCCATDDAAG